MGKFLWEILAWPDLMESVGPQLFEVNISKLHEAKRAILNFEKPNAIHRKIETGKFGGSGNLVSANPAATSFDKNFLDEKLG